MKSAASLIFFCCFLAAWADEKPTSEGTTKVKTCFPPEFAALDDNNSYAQLFKVMEEEPIYPLASDKKCTLYRFTYTPSFHSPVIVTLAVEGEFAKLYVKKGRNVSDELLLTMRVSKLAKNSWMRISPGAASNFESLLDHSDFWKLPPKRKDFAEGLDGAGWLLEAVKGWEIPCHLPPLTAFANGLRWR